MKDFRSIVDKLKGPLVPVMCAFDEDENLDLESTCRWIDWLIAGGIRLFWTTYGTSHFWGLTDSEVMELTRAVAGVTRGRALLIAGTNFHWPLRKCMEFADLAAESGADIVKLQVDWRWNPDEDVVLGFYRRLAEDSPLPLFAYTLADAKTRGMSCTGLRQVLAIPQFVGMKNDSGDFYENCEYLRTVRLQNARFAIMTGGSMMSFLHGREFSAAAFAAAIGFFAPKVPLAFAGHLEEGRRAEAVQLIREYEEPYYALMRELPHSHYAFDHAALKLMGHFKSSRIRHPFKTCGSDAEKAIAKFLRDKGIL